MEEEKPLTNSPPVFPANTNLKQDGPVQADPPPNPVPGQNTPPIQEDRWKKPKLLMAIFLLFIVLLVITFAVGFWIYGLLSKS